MGVYDNLAAAGERLVAKYGADCVWSQAATPTPATGKPWESEQAAPPTTYPVKVVLARDTQAKFAALVAGTDVPDGSQLGYMAPVPFEPAVGDLLTTGATALRVVGLSPIQPAGTVLLWVVRLEQ